MKEKIRRIDECCFAYKNQHIDFNQVFTLNVLKKRIDSAINNGATHFVVQMSEGKLSALNNLLVEPAHLRFLFGKYDTSKLECKKNSLQREIDEIDKILNSINERTN